MALVGRLGAGFDGRVDLSKRHAVRVVAHEKRLILTTQRHAIDTFEVPHFRHHLWRTGLSDEGRHIKRHLLEPGRRGRLRPSRRLGTGPRLTCERADSKQQDRQSREPPGPHGFRSSLTSVPENTMSKRIRPRPVLRIVWYSPAAITQKEPAVIACSSSPTTTTPSPSRT